MLWVDTPVLADLEIEEVPLSAVYAEAYGRVNSASERFRTQVATQALAQTILDNFGFVPDHYITVDEEAFVEYVDLLGGIEVDLPEAVDGTSEGYGYYQAGVQLLDGTRTLNFARLYHPSGMDEFDLWGNQERQNLVVRGILAATLKPQNWTKVPALMNEVLGAVVTDLSLQQTLDLACMAEKVGDSTRMLEVSEEMVSMDESRRLIPDVEAIKELIAQMGSSD
jgi:LCP family protein required for cell wall assembly